jgi:BOS complex subunit NOMO
VCVFFCLCLRNSYRDVRYVFMMLTSTPKHIAAVVVCVTVFTLLTIDRVSADHIGTCGGFVKAAGNLGKNTARKLDYSSISVRLVTRDGVEKYTTECAPNGYYFIPIYDRGSFFLQVQGPDGWAFETTKVPVEVSDATPGCEDDVNFKFTGFSISGAVLGVSESDCPTGSSGAGPEGVKATLSSRGSDDVIATTDTDAQGAFRFSNVFPGSYTVRVSHASLPIANTEQDVSMDLGNVVLDKAFQVSGYDLSGRVLADNKEPVSGVNVFLYSESEKRYVKCAAIDSDLPTPDKDTSPLCVAQSDARGQFTFTNLPCGQYQLIPHYDNSKTVYDVVPSQLAVTVAHESQALKQDFVVMGFSVSGRVVDRKGNGVSEAVITVDSFEKTVTDSEGYYTLEQMSSDRPYTIVASKPHVFFHDLRNQRVSASTGSLPDITVVKYHVCGRVDSGEAVRDRNVALKGAQFELSTTTESVGSYCFQVVPGTYTVTPASTSSEKSRGILLAPPERRVVVQDAPILDVDFTQARVSLSGRVECDAAAGDMCSSEVSIHLVPARGSAAEQSGAARREAMPGSNGAFSFANVIPGEYDVVIDHDWLCFDQDKRSARVSFEDVTDINFKQTGYVVSVRSSNSIELQYSLNDDKSASKNSVSLTTGDHVFCVPRAGQYQLVPQGCYEFANEAYEFDTSDPKLVEINASRYLVQGRIVVNEQAQKYYKKLQKKYTFPSQVPVRAALFMQEIIGSQTTQEMYKVMPQFANATRVKNTEGKSIWYEYSFYLVPDKEWVITPESHSIAAGSVEYGFKNPELLAYPERRKFEPSGEECTQPVEEFELRPGKYLVGSITPPIQDVKVNLTRKHREGVSMVAAVAPDGTYQLGPLRDDEQYIAIAEHDDFHFVEKKPFHFTAMKLGSIRVSVKDESGQGIENVILSASAEDYRANNMTDANGQFHFKKLFPGSYFFRPLLKEYTFKPKNAMVDIEDVAAPQLTFTATRVAFSAFGSVRALNGDPEANVVIEAYNADDSEKRIVEQTTTDSEGNFRLRGLARGKTFVLRAREVQNNADVERAAPAAFPVTISESKKDADVHGVEFVAFHKLSAVDLTGEVSCAVPEHLDTLTAEVVSASDPGKALYSSPISHSMPFFSFPPLEPGRYSVRIVSTLSSQTHRIQAPELFVELTDAHRHLKLSFSADVRALQTEVQQSSIAYLVLTYILVFLFVFRERLVEIVHSIKHKTA